MNFFYTYEEEKVVRYENKIPEIKTTLNEVIADGKIFKVEEFHSILYQAFSILDELRSVFPPVLHNKINPSNILLDKEKKKIALVNFNIGSQKEIFLAPEHEFPTPKTDLYSLGMTMLVLLGFDISSVKRDEKEKIILEDLNLSTDNKKLLHKMTALNPNNRFRDMKEAKNILNKIIKKEISEEDWQSEKPIMADDVNILDKNNYYDELNNKEEEYLKKKDSYLKIAGIGTTIIFIVLYILITKA